MSTFYLPTGDNQITQSDIQRGMLRISVESAVNFPQVTGPLTVRIAGKDREVRYTKRERRSDTLAIGVGAMADLHIKAGNRIKVTALERTHFVFEKV